MPISDHGCEENVQIYLAGVCRQPLPLPRVLSCTELSRPQLGKLLVANRSSCPALPPPSLLQTPAVCPRVPLLRHSLASEALHVLGPPFAARDDARNSLARGPSLLGKQRSLGEGYGRRLASTDSVCDMRRELATGTLAGATHGTPAGCRDENSASRCGVQEQSGI